ncbi:MAG: hypothetical protein LBR43_00960 [Spiroplasmataceae bacterium]|nr:hypothetical protein [Spiroplasmataceae bacterium]
MGLLFNWVWAFSRSCDSEWIKGILIKIPYLEIIRKDLLINKKETLYAFFNLVNKSLWKFLEEKIFTDKNFLFLCEKRTRGWRLRDWKELN